MIEDLQQIGLTPGEARAYLALLELGSSTVGPIAKKAGISYSKIYGVLERLMEKGLVTFVKKAQTRFYQAADPRKLYEYLDKAEQSINKRREMLNNILPRLQALKQIPPPEEAEVFIGLQGLKTAYQTLLAKKTKESLRFFYAYDIKYAEQVEKFYNLTLPILREAKILMKGLTTEEFRKTKFFKEIPKFMDVRFVTFPLPGNIDIYQDKILQISWAPRPIGVLIQSQEMAENYKRYFDETWSIAKPSG